MAEEIFCFCFSRRMFQIECSELQTFLRNDGAYAQVKHLSCQIIVNNRVFQATCLLKGKKHKVHRLKSVISSDSETMDIQSKRMAKKSKRVAQNSRARTHHHANNASEDNDGENITKSQNKHSQDSDNCDAQEFKDFIVSDDNDDVKKTDEQFVYEQDVGDDADSNASSSGNDNNFEPNHELLHVNEDVRDIFEWCTVKHTDNGHNKPILYDIRGIRIDVFDLQAQISSVEFVVLPNVGVVLSLSYLGCYVFAYRRKRKVLRYAPCQLIDFEVKKKHKIQCKVRWMRKYTSFQKFNPNRQQSQTHFMSDTTYIDIKGACAAVSQMPMKAKEQVMPRYKSVLQHWETSNPSKLRSLPLGHKLYVDAHADVFDFLEFFYATDKHIWRTQLGQWINTQYIARVINFGNGPKPKLIRDAMLATTFKQDEFHTMKNGLCTACAKNGISCQVMLDQKMVFVGSWCAQKLHFAHHIGREIQTFKQHYPVFEVSQCQMFVANLHKWFNVFKAQKF